MDLHSYISDVDKRRALAADCRTSPEYLWQIATNWRGRQAGIDLAKRIETATAGTVTRYDLRPDVFGPAPAPTPEAQDAA